MATSDAALAGRVRALGAERRGRDDVPGAAVVSELTIDELAQRTGMTVRNVRAHQSRGLLPPPEVRGRTGYYGPEHVARIELIRELQDDGFNLELIRRLLDSAGSSAAALRFTRAIRAPFGDEEPQVVTAEELAERWGTNDPKLARRAEELGLMRPLGDGTLRGALTRAGARERRAGGAGDLGAAGARGGRQPAQARRLRRPRLHEAVRGGGMEAVRGRPGGPRSAGTEVSDALERMRPLATESLLAMFGMAMDDATERTFGRQLERLPERRKR